MSKQQEPIRPRNGHTPVVGIVARISGGQNQKELSLDDQIDHAKEVVSELYDGSVEYRVISTTGKGERLDRPELAEVEAMIRSGELDVLIAEDLGRIVRGTEALWLCGIAVDHGTRVIAPNDGIDTAEAAWEEDAISACRDHVGHNAHTSKRIKQKLMNRFKHGRGATALPIYGYIVPESAETYSDWKKDPAATDVIAEWFRRLKEVPNCSAVADSLNDKKVPTGPYARGDIWDGKMVRRVTTNSLLKGLPGRGHKHTVKHHETGRRVSVKNPDGPTFREYPHLAHVEPELFDEVNRILEAANDGLGRKPINGQDPLSGRPKKRTRFPGQHARCAYCGRIYVWGGNGVLENLQCSGSRAWKCWNSIGFCGADAAAAVEKALREELDRLEGFDEQFRALVEEAGRRGGAGATGRWSKLQKDLAALGARRTNLLDAITTYGPKPMFEEKLLEMAADEKRLEHERRDLERLQHRAPDLPGSVAELRHLFEEKFQVLAAGSPEFGALLQKVVPEFHVHLVRLCDGGHLLPRAQVTLSLGGIIPDVPHAPEVAGLLTRHLTIDLFKPPQRERIRVEAVRLTALGCDQREIARRSEETLTQAGVCQALALDRRMKELGLDSPYVLVREPPGDYPKLRRHLNSRYRFEPLDGYRPLEL